MSNMIELTSANIDAVLSAHDFLLIDFWAPWCAPCDSFSEVLKRVAAEYQDVVFASVNIDTEAELREEFSVISIPRVMILRNRTVVYDDVGALSVSVLKQLLDETRAMGLSEV